MPLWGVPHKPGWMPARELVRQGPGSVGSQLSWPPGCVRGSGSHPKLFWGLGLNWVL